MSDYRSPILCRVYKVAAICAAVGAVISLLGVVAAEGLARASAFGGFGICLVAAILLYGVAEVIDLIGKTAFHSQRAAESQDAVLTELRRAAGGKSHGAVPNAGETELLEAISKDLKGLRGQVDNIEAGPLAQLGWLGTIAQNTEK